MDPSKGPVLFEESLDPVARGSNAGPGWRGADRLVQCLLGGFAPAEASEGLGSPEPQLGDGGARCGAGQTFLGKRQGDAESPFAVRTNARVSSASGDRGAEGGGAARRRARSRLTPASARLRASGESGLPVVRGRSRTLAAGRRAPPPGPPRPPAGPLEGQQEFGRVGVVPQRAAHAQ